MTLRLGFIVIICLWTCALGWINQYDQPFSFTCPRGEFLAHIISQHDNYFEDRIWDFSCRSPGNDVKLTNCEWSGYVNEFDNPVFYQCPLNGIVTGISSYHDNNYEDRRFKFECCQATGYLVADCEYTEYVNRFDEHMEFVVSACKVLRGADSYHLNSYEDRRWKFEICDLIEH